MTARKNNVSAMTGLGHGENERADAVAGLIFFRRNSLPAGQDCFKATEVNDYIAAFKTANGTS